MLCHENVTVQKKKILMVQKLGLMFIVHISFDLEVKCDPSCTHIKIKSSESMHLMQVYKNMHYNESWVEILKRKLNDLETERFNETFR